MTRIMGDSAIRAMLAGLALDTEHAPATDETGEVSCPS